MAKSDSVPNLLPRLIQELQCSGDSSEMIGELLEAADKERKSSYSAIMKILCDLDMSDDDAEHHFDRILVHTAKLKQILNREIGLRVGMLDYFLNIRPTLQCPKLIELGNYRSIVSLSTIDDLTGLYNRRFFENHLAKELKRAWRYNQTFSIVLLDLDDFKKINDNYGHPAGDSVLKEFAYVCKNQLRIEDIAARFGGEEFILLLPQTNSTGARIFSQRLLMGMKHHNFNNDITISFSGGIANFPQHGTTKEELIEHADKGLYFSKEKGKSRVSVYYDKRRASKRYWISETVEFNYYNDNYYQAQTKNVSLTGMAAATQTQLKTGDIIHLRITSKERAVTYDVQAQIMWITPTPQENTLLFGAKYNSEDQDRLSQVLTHLLPNGAVPDYYDQPSLF